MRTTADGDRMRGCLYFYNLHGSQRNFGERKRRNFTCLKIAGRTRTRPHRLNSACVTTLCTSLKRRIAYACHMYHAHVHADMYMTTCRHASMPMAMRRGCGPRAGAGESEYEPSIRPSGGVVLRRPACTAPAPDSGRARAASKVVHVLVKPAD